MRAGSRRSAGRAAAGLAALAVSAALALSACGGGSGEATASGGDGSETTAAQPQKPDPPTPATTCRDQIGTFVIGLDELRKNLVAGLDYEGYVGEMKAIRKVYDAIPVDRLALACLHSAGTPGEKALNRYIAAGNTWTDCVEADGCEAATIEAALQAKWRQASRYLSKAQQGLRDQSAG
ncbi:MAG TPA: hypothetical protein VMT37_07240 [Solirubrobacterales bacterium]|nr:hypothetical protein [Solirubrobacterales bacterium]